MPSKKSPRKPKDRRARQDRQPGPDGAPETGRASADFACCPVCGGPLVEIRGKRQCQRCHAICETCCEGDRE
jgi:hypothetical protein